MVPGGFLHVPFFLLVLRCLASCSVRVYWTDYKSLASRWWGRAGLVVFFLGLARSIVWLCVDLLAARAVDRVPLADGKKTHTALWCPVVFLILHLPFYLIMVGGLLAKKSELFSPNFDFNFCF